MSLLKRARRIGKKFQNPVPTEVGGPGVMFKVLPLYLSNRAETEPKQPLGPFRTDVGLLREPPANGLRLTWFGHSGLLLEIDGFRVLIDPVWEQRVSPVQWMGPKRFFPPTMELEELPELHVVLISHDHYDHMGAETIQRLSRLKTTLRAQWVTSRGCGRRLRQFGVAPERVQELDWTQGTEIAASGTGPGLQITAWPARHFSGRTALDRFTTLWSSFVLEGSQHRVYFGADSGPWPGFAEIAERYEGFDLTMLEIGAYHPLWGTIHLGPAGAAEAYRQMGGPGKAGRLFPIHWGLFNLALHGWREPIEELTAIADQEDWRLFLPTPGVPTQIDAETPAGSAWWRREARSALDVQHSAAQGDLRRT